MHTFIAEAFMFEELHNMKLKHNLAHGTPGLNFIDLILLLHELKVNATFLQIREYLF